MIEGLLLLSLAAALPLPEIGFRFRGKPGVEPPAGGVAVELALSGASARADLLVDDGGAPPRWKWVDGADARGASVTLRAAPGSPALLVVRRPGASGYALDGPFVWPSSPGRRPSLTLAKRTLRGSDVLGAGAELRLVGAGSGDALCEIGRDGWQCPAAPAAFAGRIVVCERGRALAAAEVRPDLPDAVALRRLLFAGVLRFERPERAADPIKISVRVMRPAAAGSRVLVPDREWGWSDLGEGLVWLEGKSDVPGSIVEAREPGFAAARLSLPEVRYACADPVSVALVRAVRLGGSVSDASGRPVARALVLARPHGDRGGETPIADTHTDESGEFELGDLEPGRYRLRACHPELGCGESDAVAGDRAAITVGAGASFAGRVLSSAGVPEPAANVRIVPAADTWANAPDRMTRLPLETVSGEDGRFRIVAPDVGDFLLEIRAPASGVARVPVRRSKLSPALTDLGDVRLPEPLELAVLVARCGGGILSMSGPLGGETSLPGLVRAPLDVEGAATVRVPEGGAWTAWAACAGSNVALDPALLPDVGALSGIEVRFEPAGALAVQSPERSK